MKWRRYNGRAECRGQIGDANLMGRGSDSRGSRQRSVPKLESPSCEPSCRTDEFLNSRKSVREDSRRQLRGGDESLRCNLTGRHPSRQCWLNV